MGPAGIALIAIVDTVFGAKARHQLRQAFAEGGRQKGALRIALAITLNEMWEFFLQKGKKDGSRARLQEKRVGKNGFRAGACGGLDQSFEVAGIVGDAGKHGSADDSGGNAREVHLTNGFQAQIGARGARFEDAREVSVDSRDGDIDEDAVVASDFAEKFGVAEHQIRFRDDADLETAVTRKLLEDGAGDFVAPLGGLVGVGGGADSDLFAGLDLPEFLAKKVGGVLLDEDLVLEILVGHLHELVGVASVTIFAGKLTSAVGIDRPGERQVAIADHAVKQRTGGKGEVLDVMAFANGLSLGRKTSDADEFGAVGIGEEREGGHEIRLLFAHGTKGEESCQRGGGIGDRGTLKRHIVVSQ